LPNDENLISEILKLKSDCGAEKIVAGESKDFNGQDNPIMSQVRGLKSELEKSGVEVVLHPEILTTMEARQLQGQTDMTDASAAALILKSYIDSTA
jgi:RNase H-fold protein (predicted Holliday junction resolvase)